MTIGKRLSLSGGAMSNPYVTDGLIAMWDGEWNCGIGAHTSEGNTIKDLSGNGFDVTFVNGVTFNDKNFIVTHVTSSDESNTVIEDADSLNEKLLETFGSNTYEIILDKSNRAITDDNWGVLSFSNDSWMEIDLFNNNNTREYGCILSPYHNKFNANPYLHCSIVHAGESLFYDGESTTYSAGWRPGGGGSRFSFFDDKPDSTPYYCFRLYNRTLTAKEVAANYLIDKARFGLT